LLVASIAVLGLVPAQPASAAATLRADYRFQDSLASSVGSAPAIAADGTGLGFQTEDVRGVPRRVLTWPADTGFRIPGVGSILPNGTGRYTIAILFRFEEVGAWRRIINFEPRAQDKGLYFDSGNDLVFHDYAQDADTNVVANQYVDVLLTRNAEGIVKGYLDGQLVFSFPDTENAGVIANDLGFMIDNSTEESPGAAARVRIWDDALSDAEVATLGPGDDCPGDRPGNNIAGTSGKDRLLGTPGADVVCGLGGKDTLIGGDGADVLIGGGGKDILKGGGGKDTCKPGGGGKKQKVRSCER
jgi:Ca2+-binding RTX toxin-like protein